jgi:PAS domain S-box-containing protein
MIESLATNRATFRVLLVDDDPYCLEIVKHMLSKAANTNFELEYASTFEQALSPINACKHDAYIFDYYLGDQTGLDLLKYAQHHKCSGPVIMLTGHADQEMGLQLVRAGAADYLDKAEITSTLLERSIRYSVEKFRAESQFRKLVDCAPFGMLVTDDDQRIVLANQRAGQMFNFDVTELDGMPLDAIISEKEATSATTDHGSSASSLENMQGIRRNGDIFPVDFSVSSFDVNGRPLVIWGLRDITETVNAQREILRNRRKLENERAKISAMIRSTPHGLCFLQSNWMIGHANNAFYRIAGIESSVEQVSFGILFSSPESFASYTKEVEAALASGSRHIKELMLLRSGKPMWCEISVARVGLRPNQSSFIATITDLTPQKRTQLELKEQVGRLTALREIDLAIAGDLQSQNTLEVFLEKVEQHLGVDACTVLRFSHDTGKLYFEANRGFGTHALQHTTLGPGEGTAGRAASECRTIIIEDEKELRQAFEKSPLLKNERFVSYYAVPLIAHGKVQGVLELFHRSYFTRVPTWMDFLNTLAGQAAIALDNANLFEGLQKLNSELCTAYDATLLGWSRALELRDIETHGHTLRVTELTVRLARRMGLSEEMLTHIQRGAMLHDIGKMGVPDSILLKPGPLSDSEWEIMRKHPSYAYDLLKPVKFLEPALDIPLHHHEKWNGTGYPRQLSGNDIPLSARIFAVIDVWDALRTDRPYRAKWSEDEARNFLAEQAGKHFDPEIVQLFLSNGLSHEC